MVVLSLDLETVVLILAILLAGGGLVVAQSLIRSRLLDKENEELCYVSDPTGNMDYHDEPRATGRFKHVLQGAVYTLYAEYEYWKGDAYERVKDKYWKPADDSDMELYYIMEYNERL